MLLSLLIHSGQGVFDGPVSGVSFEVFTVYSFHKPKERRMNSEITTNMNVNNIMMKRVEQFNVWVAL
jgi:hypothetical protein